MRPVHCLFAVALGSWPSNARADDAAIQCVEDHYQGQVTRRNGALLESKKLLAACAAARCPELVRAACLALGEQLEAAIPAVIATARDERGLNLPNAGVVVDASERPFPLQGQAIALDPGTHRLRFVAPGYQPQTLIVALTEGEAPRPVVVHLQTNPPAKPLAIEPGAARGQALSAPIDADMPRGGSAERQRAIHPLAYVFGGVAVAASGSWAYFGLRGMTERADCADRQPCAPGVNSKLLIADVSLGIGVASLAAGAYFLFSSHANDPPSSRRRPLGARSLAVGWSHHRAATVFDVMGEF